MAASQAEAAQQRNRAGEAENALQQASQKASQLQQDLESLQVVHSVMVADSWLF